MTRATFALLFCITHFAFFFFSTSAYSRTLEMFSLEYEGCYDRKTEPYTFVVDSHVHFQPFGGPAIPFDEMLTYLQKSEVFFANVYGIGQKLPSKSPCTYYLDCPGTPVTPSLSNDFVNANLVSVRLPNKLPQNINLTLSMSFTDLQKPETIVPNIKLLDKEYPNMFTWMGEINVVKQALFHNHTRATPKENIAEWKGFMQILVDRNIPVSFHSDLGNDKNPTKYIHLMEEILQQYPDNIIVWHHMGLSKELSNMNPSQHIKIMKRFLDENPNLFLDISWRVLYDEYFSKKSTRALYVKFFNAYPTRILPGTDFVAADNKNYETYREEVEVNSRINQYMDDETFRNIALGQNYFNILGLPFKAPKICTQ